jgi:hypothetical protein
LMLEQLRRPKTVCPADQNSRNWSARGSGAGCLQQCVAVAIATTNASLLLLRWARGLCAAPASRDRRRAADATRRRPAWPQQWQ